MKLKVVRNLRRLVPQNLHRLFSEPAIARKTLVPILISWLDRVADDGVSADSRILDILRSAFTSGDVKNIYSLSGNDANKALTIMVKACDVSSIMRNRADREARQLLVETFRTFVNILKIFPLCLCLEDATVRVDVSRSQRIIGRTTEVYPGFHKERQVALKVIQDHESVVNQSEIATWRTLPAHDHVLPFLGCVDIITGTPEKILWGVAIVTPWFPRRDILRYLESQQRLPSGEQGHLKNHWARDLSGAASHIHSHELVHGNICLDNVYLDVHHRACLGGFGGSGLALIMGPTGTTGVTGARAHRKEILPPERLMEPAYVPTMAADVYALGVSILQLFLQGRSPYDDDDQAHMWFMTHIPCGERPSKPNDVDDDLWDLVTECLADSPSARPTAKDVFARISEILPIQPHPLTQYFRPLILSLSIEEEGTLSWMKLRAENRELHKIGELSGQRAKFAINVLDKVLDATYATPMSGTDPPTIRSEIRPLLLKLAPETNFLPPSFWIKDFDHHGHVDRVVRTGAFGEILRGTYKGRAVALKRPRGFSTMVGAEFKNKEKDFIREAITWKSLKHENILPFLGLGKNKNRMGEDGICIVLPWMRNGHAREYSKNLRQNRDPLFNLKINRLLHGAASGVEFLHCEGVVHSDIRGANILVDDNGIACLTDFGLSRNDGAGGSISPSFTGNPSWLAPELLYMAESNVSTMEHPRMVVRALHDAIPTTASDVFSFGRVCIELYTGQDPAEALRSQSIRRIFSPPLADLVNRCCHDNARKRPSASMIVEKLRESW